MEHATIKVDDLLLRPFVTDDIRWVYEVSLDPAVQQYVNIPLPYRVEHADHFVRELAMRGWDEEARAEFVIERDAVRLGRVGLWFEEVGTARIGYWMDPAARGAGVATAAVRAACRWGFQTLGLALVEWRAEVGNQASRRVAEKSGFTVEAVLRQRLVHRGVRVDAWVGSLLASEIADH